MSGLSKDEKVRELQLRILKGRQAMLSKGNAEVPSKKASKPLGYKLQNTFAKNLQGVPGGSTIRAMSDMKMIEAVHTGTITATEEQQRRLGLMRSRRNANTTQGSYNPTILQDQTGDIISNRQGRDVR